MTTAIKNRITDGPQSPLLMDKALRAVFNAFMSVKETPYYTNSSHEEDGLQSLTEDSAMFFKRSPLFMDTDSANSNGPMRWSKSDFFEWVFNKDPKECVIQTFRVGVSYNLELQKLEVMIASMVYHLGDPALMDSYKWVGETPAGILSSASFEFDKLLDHTVYRYFISIFQLEKKEETNIFESLHPSRFTPFCAIH